MRLTRQLRPELRPKPVKGLASYRRPSDHRCQKFWTPPPAELDTVARLDQFREWFCRQADFADNQGGGTK